MSRVLGVAKSNLSKRVNMRNETRSKRYHRESDNEVLSLIREVVDRRPTYGYRRVHALINGRLKTLGRAGVNHKRVYRIMKMNALLLERHTGKAQRQHTGQVITLLSNTRWCSDVFGIQCWNGDRVYVGFALDTCDREALGHIASTIGMNGEAIRDLMLEAVEYRFGDVEKLASPIQWLSDNGPCYTAHETVNFARSLGFEVCTTPAYSPESNGMAEAFVKRFKQDYVYFGDLKDARTVMAQLPGWFEDYNENAPHKGLNMMSPRQFLRKSSAN